MISLRGAPLLRPFLIFGLLGMAMIASFSRIQGYKNHWADIWWAWVIGGLTAIYLKVNNSKAAFILHGTATVTAAVTNRISVHVTCKQSYLTSVFSSAV
uniref:Phosphatidic acid phosphatase type 2/haloperoxidase domain-containing protein n=1 Tax=Romanomermis culicivorax TaxID=13658 RepID=A0A915JFB4_ROMCU